MTARSFDSLLARRESTEDFCTLQQARRVAALLDQDLDLAQGDVFPRGWHFCLFTPTTPQSLLKGDGQVGEDSLLANPDPENFPRRVLGGRRTTFDRDIHIGACIRRESSISGAAVKEGRSGRFLLVTARHVLSEAQGTQPALIEEQDAIFMPPKIATRSSPLNEGSGQEQDAISRRVKFDTTMLFRYSAITFNAHRIHYDHPYTTTEEGYPGLVVNGGLSALFLLELAKSHINRPITSVSTRNVGLLHVGEDVVLRGRTDIDQWIMRAETTAGRRAVEMTVS